MQLKARKHKQKIGQHECQDTIHIKETRFIGSKNGGFFFFLPIQKATHSDAGLKSDTFRRRAEKRHIQKPG